uniref:Uncharacterized protein n=1 Tax=Eptatretus burgeri TaxID=7764 RepID=A0A8C4QH77_EPTBU
MLDNSVASHELTMWRCHGISLHLPYRAQTSRLRGELSDALSQQQKTHASAQALQEMLDAVSAHSSLLEETQAKLRAQVSDLEKDVEHHRRLRIDEKSHTQAELAELQMQLKYRSQDLEQITKTYGKLQADFKAAQDEGERQHEAAEQSRKREDAAKNHAQQLQTEMEQLQERADKMELLDVEAKALRADLVICAEETRIAEEEAVKARKEAQEALSTRDEAEEVVARAREALSGVEEKFTALNNQLRVTRDCANERGKELDHLSALLHERQLELQQRSAQVLELEGRVSTRQAEMEVTVTNLQNVLETTQKQVSVFKERLHKTERNLQDKCSELEKANNRNEKLTHNVEILEQDKLRQWNHAEQLHQMSTDVRNRLEFLQLECSRLQTELEEMTRVCQEKELRQRHLAEELGAKQARICLLESRLQAEGSVLST